MKIAGLKLNQIALSIGGIALIASLPWFGIWEVWLWLGAYLAVLIGVAAVLKNI
jgi:hypothetical protein